MRYNPSSKVLFVSICSLTKNDGGSRRYESGDAIAASLTPDLADRLQQRREKVRQLVFGASDTEWQGVELSELEYNRRLARGPDFGGSVPADYLPAVERYGGRFFLGLGPDRTRLLRDASHHLLLLSGLYGVVQPFEPVQLYSCPLDAKIARLWRDDNVLTDILRGYVERWGIERIIDLTAIDAYRGLVEWDEVIESENGVLHCFHSMGAGDYALIPFGEALRDRLLGMSEDALAALEPEHRMGNIVFTSLPRPAAGFPNEAAAIAQFRREERLVEAHPIESVGEVLAGGNPLRRSKRGSGEWRFATMQQFQKDVWSQPQLFERATNAIVEICMNPTTPRGNTIKPLSGDQSGLWRYRLGDFRLIYRPDEERRTIYCHRLTPRGGAYD